MLFLRLTVAVIIFFIVGQLSNNWSVIVGKPTTEMVSTITAPKRFPIEKPLIGFALGTLTSMVLEKLLYLDNKEAQCALSIQNTLTSYRLINPYLYIEHGGNIMPAPLKINVNSSEETTFEAVALTGDTSGLLFYEIEYVGLYLMIFWKVHGRRVLDTYNPNIFSVDIISNFQDNQQWLTATYSGAKQNPAQMQGPNEYFELEKEVLQSTSRPTVPQFKITILGQMTTGKQAKFVVELKDNLAPFTAPQSNKRDVIATSLALAVIPLGLNLALKKIKSLIPSEQSCTIYLENLSKEGSLTRPRWFITAGDTTNIIPWEIKGKEVGEITFVIPLGGTKILDTLKHTVYFLSYHIEGTDYDIVIGTWFPLKLETKDNSKPSLRKETPRYTIFIVAPPKNVPMKNVLQIIGNLLIEYKSDPAQIDKALITKNKAIYDSIALTNLKNPKIALVEATKFQTYKEWQYPIIGTSSRAEYHIKILSAIGIGKTTGLVVKVEVVPGKSPPSFAQQNPQNYKEPPETATVGTQFPAQGKTANVGTQDIDWYQDPEEVVAAKNIE